MDPGRVEWPIFSLQLCNCGLLKSPFHQQALLGQMEKITRFVTCPLITVLHTKEISSWRCLLVVTMLWLNDCKISKQKTTETYIFFLHSCLIIFGINMWQLIVRTATITQRNRLHHWHKFIDAEIVVVMLNCETSASRYMLVCDWWSQNSYIQSALNAPWEQWHVQLVTLQASLCVGWVRATQAAQTIMVWNRFD